LREHPDMMEEIEKKIREKLLLTKDKNDSNPESDSANLEDQDDK
jgi:hypothetical protein